MKKIISLSLLSLLALAPGVSLAVTTGTGPNPNVLDEVSDITDIITSIIGWLFFFLLLVATVMILYAAWLYLTAAGSDDKIKKANKTILYAAIAIVVAVIARGLPRLVQNFVETNAS